MKTTLNLDDLLLQRAKALAAKHKTSLTRLIEEGLQLRLRTAAMDAKAMHAAAPKIPVFKGKGGMPSSMSLVRLVLCFAASALARCKSKSLRLSVVFMTS